MVQSVILFNDFFLHHFISLIHSIHTLEQLHEHLFWSYDIYNINNRELSKYIALGDFLLSNNSIEFFEN